ncbi:MAG: FxsA family protein [Tissierellia bacterium]|nr:FxsA family protein [Tissierellia bacterium]
MKKLLPLFLILLVLEIYILIKAVEIIGLLETILLLLLTAAVGIIIAISEGRIVLRNINRALSQRRVPADDILSGLCILMGGLMLFLPGILTDLVGITMVIPVTRKFYKEIIRSIIENMILKGYNRIRLRW